MGLPDDFMTRLISENNKEEQSKLGFIQAIKQLVSLSKFFALQLLAFLFSIAVLAAIVILVF
jgi:hypothetical protein